MSNLWLKIRIWTKVGLLALVLLYALFFVIKNGGQDVPLWFWFYHETTTSVLILILVTFLLGVVTTLLARVAVKTVRQIQHLRAARQQRDAADAAGLQAKADMLQTKPVSAPDGTGIQQ